MSNTALSVITSDPPEKWQEILADLITDPKELTEILQLDGDAGSDSQLAHSGLNRFSLKVPRPFAQRMRPGNWDDPLLRQVWPSQLEDEVDCSLSEDPLQERSLIRQEGCCKNIVVVSCLPQLLIVQCTVVIASGDTLTTRPTRRASNSGGKLWGRSIGTAASTR